MINARIIGTGSYYPTEIIQNKEFNTQSFYKGYGQPTVKSGATVTTKFEEVTGIKERRYLSDHLMTSDMGFIASERALECASTSAEEVDMIIFAHNWGDVSSGTGEKDVFPNLACRVKKRLGIKNPRCVGYDILFGCPTWLHALSQADLYICAGRVSKVLVIGADTASRAVDPEDIDMLLFSDAAGAVLMEATQNSHSKVLAYDAVSDCGDELEYLKMGPAYTESQLARPRYLKMKGREVYRYACSNVPCMIADMLKKEGVDIENVKYFFFHQANARMIQAMANRLAKITDVQIPESKVPINADWLGNSAAATIPVILDEVLRSPERYQPLEAGDLIVFASVGAGMHANCMLYRW